MTNNLERDRGSGTDAQSEQDKVFFSMEDSRI